MCRPSRKIENYLRRKLLAPCRIPMSLLSSCLYYYRKIPFLFLCRNCRKLHFQRVLLKWDRFAPYTRPTSRNYRRRKLHCMFLFAFRCCRNPEK